MQIHDLAAATFNPYNEDGSVNYAGVDAHAKDLARHGVMFAFSSYFVTISSAYAEQRFNKRRYHKQNGLLLRFSTAQSMEQLVTVWL